MQYGTSVYGPAWDATMSKAEDQATMFGGKSKVFAVLNSSRARKNGAPKYTYTVMLPDEVTFSRCGKKAPNGKPCVLRRDHAMTSASYEEHLSRSTEKGKVLRWAVVSREGVASSPRGSIVCMEIDDEFARKAGLL